MVLYARITKTSRMGAGGNHFLFVQLSSSTSCPSWSLCWEENLKRLASLKCGRLLTCQVKSKGRTPAVELTADEKGQLVYRKVFYNPAIDLVGHSRVWPSVSPHVTGGLGLTGAWNWEKKARGISLPLCCPSVDVVSGGSGFLGHIYHATHIHQECQPRVSLSPSFRSVLVLGMAAFPCGCWPTLLWSQISAFSYGASLWSVRFFKTQIPLLQSPMAQQVKKQLTNAGDWGHVGVIPRLERYTGEGNGNPCQYSFLKNPKDREAWQDTVHGVAKTWTPLSGHAAMETHSGDFQILDFYWCLER